jgi:hypothetical protein
MNIDEQDSRENAENCLIKMDSWALVAHTCNPGYSGGRDQEDHSSKPAHRQIVHETLSQKTLHKNRANGLAQGEGPEFKPQYWKKNGQGEKSEEVQ